MITVKENSITVRCDEAVNKFALLSHPFYQRWSAGTLPVCALKDYAANYGAFIGAIPDGWRTVGNDQIAGIEEGHAKLWDRTFAAALDTPVASADKTSMAGLLAA